MKAFTLVETLVAVTIVLLAVTGPFQLVKSSLMASYTARDQMIASALAEEGFEYVRSVRDANYLYVLAHPGSNRDWLTGIGTSPNCFSSNCTIAPTEATPIAVCSATCQPLKIHPTSGLYTQAAVVGAATTRFTRSVRLEDVDGGHDRAVKVTVTVSYISNHTPFTVTVTDYLYNWL